MRLIKSIQELTAEVRALRTAAQTIALELHSKNVADEEKPYKVHYANEQPERRGGGQKTTGAHRTESKL